MKKFDTIVEGLTEAKGSGTQKRFEDTYDDLLQYDAEKVVLLLNGIKKHLGDENGKVTKRLEEAIQRSENTVAGIKTLKDYFDKLVK